MLLYINSFDFTKIEVKDLIENDKDIFTDLLFITPTGIYKQYKNHFYKLNNLDINSSEFEIEGISICIQNETISIDRSDQLTMIPLKHIFVQRETAIIPVNDYIDMIYTIDNQIYEKVAFRINNENSDFKNILQDIGMFLHVHTQDASS
jgi:hypothetical protein